MSRFHDDINRVFDQMLGSPWSRKPAPVVRPDRSSTASIWEVRIPVPNADHDELGVSISGRRVSVSIAATRRQSATSVGSVLTTNRYEERCETFTLPEGTTVEGFEAKFEDHNLLLRVRLRPRSE